MRREKVSDEHAVGMPRISPTLASRAQRSRAEDKPVEGQHQLVTSDEKKTSRAISEHRCNFGEKGNSSRARLAVDASQRAFAGTFAPRESAVDVLDTLQTH